MLIVDDNSTFVTVLRYAIEGSIPNCTVDASVDPIKALQLLSESVFSVILCDYRMPEMDGIELARRAAELDPDIKIMFITGFAAVALNADSTAPKQAKVLSKPIHLRDLVNEVNKMLAA